MKHSEFTEKFHWMNGLSEYFRYTGQEEKYEPIFKALYHNNYYRKRDILLKLITRDGLNINEKSPAVTRAWVNMLLNEHFDDIEVKPIWITGLLSEFSNDLFVERICRFINFFTVNDKTETMLPDLGDFLSRGQVKSKLWMVTELAKIVEGSLGTVVFYGGWHNFMAHFLYDNFDVDKIYSLDVDKNVLDTCITLYQEEHNADRFKSITCDVNKNTWNDKKLAVLDITRQTTLYIPNVTMVINTSCEHMDNTWFEELPSGTMVVLQTNDYFSNPQHSNCCENLQAAKEKYPMETFLYAGELDTHLYNRFMLIGIK